mgnify:CR=1 FL=1
MNKKLFNIINPSNNLYDRIILAIQKEKESKKLKKLIIFFTFLFCFSLSFTIISISYFVQAWKDSGIIYLLKTIISDFSLFLSLWKYFSLAFIEILPVVNLIIFILCLIFTIFSLRLLFYKKYLLLKTLLKP